MATLNPGYTTLIMNNKLLLTESLPLDFPNQAFYITLNHSSLYDVTNFSEHPIRFPGG